MGQSLKEKAHAREISLRYVFLTVVFWFLTIGWILVIFSLSAQDASQSSGLSKSVLEFINVIFGTSLVDDGVIRLAAHISEFALLTVLSYIALSSTNKISNKTSYAESPVKLLRSDNEMNIIFTLWFTILNAIFDEYHQLFVMGRNGSIINVLIDLIGIVVVLILIRIIFSIYLRSKGKTEVVYTGFSGSDQ